MEAEAAAAEEVEVEAEAVEPAEGRRWEDRRVEAAEAVGRRREDRQGEAAGAEAAEVEGPGQEPRRRTRRRERIP